MYLVDRPPGAARLPVPIIDDARLFGLIRLSDRYRCWGSVEFVGCDTTPGHKRCQAIVDNPISVLPELAKCYEPSTAKFLGRAATDGALGQPLPRADTDSDN